VPTHLPPGLSRQPVLVTLGRIAQGWAAVEPLEESCDLPP
jgi:hypothetical protein